MARNGQYGKKGTHEVCRFPKTDWRRKETCVFSECHQKKSSTCLGKSPHFPELLAASNQVNKPQFQFYTGPAVAGQTIKYCYL